MANLKYKTWLLHTNKTSFYVGESFSLNAIDYTKYDSINLVEVDNTNINWVSATYETKTVYISQHVIFNNLSYVDAYELCEKIGTVILNGKAHIMEIMPAYFWLNLPRNIYSNIHACDNLFITQSTDSYYSLLGRDSRSDAFSNEGNTEDFELTFDTEKNMPVAFIPVLVPLNKDINISGEDADLGDKVSSFGITYSVYDDDTNDVITIKEELNGKKIREINYAKPGELYTFNITPSIYASLAVQENNILKIIADDGISTATRIYTFRKINSAPTVVYEGNTSLGSIIYIPVIEYYVQDNVDDTVNVIEKLNEKLLYTGTLSTDTKKVMNITDAYWSECVGDCTLEITAVNSSGESNTTIITFFKGGSDRLEVRTNPIETKEKPENISVEVDWSTNKARGKVWVSNNAFDVKPTWEEITDKVNTMGTHKFTNSTKSSDNWGVSIRVQITKDPGNSSEINITGIRGTFE